MNIEKLVKDIFAKQPVDIYKIAGEDAEFIVEGIIDELECMQDEFDDIESEAEEMIKTEMEMRVEEYLGCEAYEKIYGR